MKVITAVKDKFVAFWRVTRIYYDLFRKEKVFKYFMIIFTLMIICAGLFFVFEYDKVMSSLPVKKTTTIIDKIVTVLYWSVVTIATVGYGDITPATSAGRVMSMLGIFLSVGAVSLFTANLASALTTKKFMERRGIMDLTDYKKHFIICGWKRDMARVLSEISLIDTKIDYSKIIVIANINADDIELFKQQYPQYDAVTILRGEYYNETLLRKANAIKASKILIVADESGQATNTEIDSKTIMTAMAIRSISKDIKISAELLDAEFEKYLRTAQIDEIIYSNEYSRLLIANSLTRVGITKIVNSLLSMQTPDYISTEKIPENYINKPYKEVKEYFRNANNAVCIGLLENVGSYFERKNEAIRKAQQTAEISRLVDNLRVAKKMEHNLTNINPQDEYLVQENSMAILIGKRG